MTDVYVVGDTVRLTFYVYDEDDNLANATASTLTVTKPDLTTTTPSLTNDPTGTYYVDYVPASVGRYLAVSEFTGTNAGVQVQVFDVMATSNSLVTLTEVKTYLGTTSWSDAEITDALDAERAAQAKSCRVDKYGVDLQQALFRRVARNLAARAIPVTTYTSFEGAVATARVPGSDPEIRRLEAPYRKLVFG